MAIKASKAKLAKRLGNELIQIKEEDEEEEPKGFVVSYL